MTEAVKQMPINKSTGNDAIPAEVFKCLDDTSLSKLYNIVSEIWREEKVPQDLKDAKFVQLYKNKGDKSDCNNYRGTSLLNIFSKIVSRIICLGFKHWVKEFTLKVNVATDQVVQQQI